MKSDIFTIQNLKRNEDEERRSRKLEEHRDRERKEEYRWKYLTIAVCIGVQFNLLLHHFLYRS